MIRVVLKSGWFYKGQILDEDSENLFLIDFKGSEVVILKSEIAVREVLPDV